MANAYREGRASHLNQKFMGDCVHDEVELRVPAKSLCLKTTAHDISYGGIGLYGHQRIPVGEEVTVVLGFLNSDRIVRFETVSGWVRWCRTKSPGFMTGIEFEKLDPGRHPRLLEFLDKTDCFRKAIGASQPPENSRGSA